MPEEKIADTTVDPENKEGSQESTESGEQTVTPANQNEVPQKSEREIALEKELSRLRAAQSAADKRAASEAQRARDLEERQRQAQAGDKPEEYWKSVAQEQARKSAELELKVATNDLLEEHTNLPPVIKDAIRKNPQGFIGNATDVPTAVVNLSNYLNDISSKIPEQTGKMETTEQPNGKQFKVPSQQTKVKDPVQRPKSLSEAAGKLVEAGFFD